MNLLATWVLLSGPAECAERSAAPPQVAPRAKSKIKVLAKYLQAQVAQLQKPRPRSPDYPLSISPPGHAHSAGPSPRLPPYRFCWLLLRFLGLPKNPLKFKSKKWRNKCENRGFRAPKTLPKSFQNASENDVPTNMGFFNDFGSKNAWLHKSRHRFCIGFYSTFCLSGTFL